MNIPVIRPRIGGVELTEVVTSDEDDRISRDGRLRRWLASCFLRLVPLGFADELPNSCLKYAERIT